MNIFHRFKPGMAVGLAAISALFLLGAGCGAKNQPSVPASGNQGQVQAPPSASGAGQPAKGESAAAVSGGCYNPYYPLKNGLTINYRQTVPGVAPFTYGLTVSDVTDTSAKMSFSFTQPVPFTAVQDLVCENGSIKAESYLDLSGEIGRAMGGMKMTTTTKNVNGELMPASLKVGDTWSTGYVYESKIEGVPASAGLSGMTTTVETVSKVLAEEPVTVPAGSFTALKIQVTSTAATTLSGGKAMPSSSSTQTEWLAKGVGLVKMVSDSPSGATTTEAIEVKN